MRQVIRPVQRLSGSGHRSELQEIVDLYQIDTDLLTGVSAPAERISSVLLDLAIACGEIRPRMGAVRGFPLLTFWFDSSSWTGQRRRAAHDLQGHADIGNLPHLYAIGYGPRAGRN